MASESVSIERHISNTHQIGGQARTVSPPCSHNHAAKVTSYMMISQNVAGPVLNIGATHRRMSGARRTPVRGDAWR